jgi:hypothetical protein
MFVLPLLSEMHFEMGEREEDFHCLTTFWDENILIVFMLANVVSNLPLLPIVSI